MQKTLTRECVSEVLVIGILVLLSLCLVGTSTSKTAFKGILTLVDEAKAIKHKTLSNIPQRAPNSSSPISAESNTTSPGGCIKYNPSTRGLRTKLLLWW